MKKLLIVFPIFLTGCSISDLYPKTYDECISNNFGIIKLAQNTINKEKIIKDDANKCISMMSFKKDPKIIEYCTDYAYNINNAFNHNKIEYGYNYSDLLTMIHYCESLK